jgi:hypothetical protein
MSNAEPMAAIVNRARKPPTTAEFPFGLPQQH